MYKLKQAILDTADAYCPPESYELAGETLTAGDKTLSADEAYCVTCEDEAFLIPCGEDCLFYDRKNSRVLAASAPDGSLKTDELDGWHASLHLAPGCTAECDFAENALSCEGEEYPAAVYKVGRRLYLAVLPEGVTLALDLSRFLFYGAADGRPFGGNVTNMELD